MVYAQVTHGSFVENGVLELLVNKRMPKLAKHMAKMGWSLPSFTQGWYATVFTSYLQPEVCSFFDEILTQLSRSSALDLDEGLPENVSQRSPLHPFWC